MPAVRRGKDVDLNTRSLYLWAASLSLLICPLVWAKPALPPLIVTNAENYSLDGHLSVFRDPKGGMDLPTIRQHEGDFQPSPGNDPAFGYHTGTIWLSFELVNPALSKRQLWLEQSWVFQEHVDLFLLDDAGNVTELRNGAAVRKEERPLPAKAILFPLDLPSGARIKAYLSLRGKASSTVKLKLWQPAAYADAGRQRMAFKYLALGSSFIVVVFSFIAWQARRKPLLLLGGLGELLILPNMMILDGFALGLLPAGAELWQTRASTLLAGLYFTCHTLFARAFFELQTLSPRLDRALLGVAIAMLLLTLAASILIAPVVIILPILVIMALLTVVALGASRRKIPAAKAYLWSWGFLWLTVAFRLLQLLGWTPFIPAMPDVHVIGIVISGLALAQALFLDAKTMRTLAQDTQEALIRERAAENMRLENAVQAKTQELQEAKEHAEEGSRAKTTFLSMMSHELRAPLHTIIGYSQLLAIDADHALRRRLGLVEQNGRELLHLIDGILDYSRNDPSTLGTDLRSISLRDFALRLVETHEFSAAQGNNTLVVLVGTTVPDWVEADERQLNQALGNLLSNACKYTDGGEITLRIELASETVQRNVPEDGQTIRFEVSDTGIGIPPGSESAIFAPFFRMDPNNTTPGVGLGLTIAQQSVAAMGGTIQYRRPSMDGKGSIFSFQLMLKACLPASVRDDQSSAIEGYIGATQTLLIADDNHENRGFLSELCKRWGFVVLEASDGDEALRLVTGSPIRIAAALVDQFMPRKSGWDLLRDIRRSPDCLGMPVILLSAAPPERPENLDFDFDAILLKPVLSATLAKHLQELLGIEWLYTSKDQAGQPHTGKEVELRLPREEIERFRGMASLGQIQGLKDWAQQIESDYPTYAASMREVNEMCENLDLRGLSQIAANLKAAD